KLKDLKAKNYLFQAIDRATLETILCKDTSKQIWDSMKKKYQGNAKAKRVLLQGLRTEFENLRMKSGETVADFFSRTMATVNKMRIHGEKIIYCDNNSAIKLSKNPVLHGRSKHIDVKYHFLQDLTRNGTLDLIYCRSKDQIADMFTKSLKLPAFQKLRDCLGMCTLENKFEGGCLN
ncbi:hypothetical protein F511_08463, partial [Dorcoceras hygrometricum]